MPNNWSLLTRLLHAGERTRGTGATPTTQPIYVTSTYVHPTAEDLDTAFAEGGLVYGRYGNPTVSAFEEAVALAENGVGAQAYGSGMAALHAAILAAGTPRGETHPRLKRIVCARDIYGATRMLVLDFFGAQQIVPVFVDMTDLAAVRAALAVPTDVVLLEPMSNPLLKVMDVAAIATLCRETGARLVVDNTLPTPLSIRPLDLGADLVVHSATKFLGGHGDVIGGVVVARKSLLLDHLRRHNKLLGAILGPFEARLLARGMKTLPLRFRQQTANALAVAEWLAEQPQVARVNYPGLSTHPQHALACEQYQSFGALMSFDLRDGDRSRAFQVMDALALFLPATTLGDIYSLIMYPAHASHRDLSPAARAEVGIGDGLLRLSIGIEDPADLISDLAQALATLGD